MREGKTPPSSTYQAT